METIMERDRACKGSVRGTCSHVGYPPKKGRWIPRFVDEARLVLRKSWLLSDALRELIRLAERESKVSSRDVAHVVAYPIGHLFMDVDDVVYAWYPELVPYELKDTGKECRSSCRDKERGVLLRDLEAIEQKIRELADKICQSLF